MFSTALASASFVSSTFLCLAPGCLGLGDLTPSKVSGEDTLHPPPSEYIHILVLRERIEASSHPLEVTPVANS